MRGEFQPNLYMDLEAAAVGGFDGTPPRFPGLIATAPPILPRLIHAHTGWLSLASRADQSPAF